MRAIDVPEAARTDAFDSLHQGAAAPRQPFPIRPASPSSTPSCRRQRNPRCSARLRGSTGRDGSAKSASPAPDVIYLTRSSLAHPRLWRASRVVHANVPATSSLIYDLFSHSGSNRGERLWPVRAAVWNPGIRRWRHQSGAREIALHSSAAIPAHMMGSIDGTWRRECVMEDVSETGAS